MPQEPKKRHSRQRKGKRRASIHLKTVKGLACSNCGIMINTHTVCAKCGYYKGKQIVAIKTKKEVEKTAK